MNLLLTTTSSSEATIATLTGNIDGEIFTWTGTAKRFPGDKFIPDIGRKLAIGRAFASAGRQFLKQGNGLVKSSDHNRAAAKLSREKRAAAKESGIEVHRIQPRREQRRRSTTR